nr:helicase_3 [Cafeteriavirus-dependent mavirus]CAI9421312.1 helicase_3 [Cafeteriavirus-dependent mavirus]
MSNQNINNIVFSLNHLKSLVSQNQEEEAKAYIEKFFFHTTVGTFFKDALHNQWTLIHEKNLKNFISSDIDNDKKGTKNFNARKYLNQSEFMGKTYYLDVIPNSPDQVLEKEVTVKGIQYNQKVLNMMCEHLHDVSKIPKFEEFEDSTKAQCKLMLDHIKTVWANNDDDMYKYIIQWLSHTFLGHKLETFLYLHSMEGTGKSIVYTFISQFVLGHMRAIMTSTPGHITKWTKILEGTSLVNLNEMPVSSDYKGFNEALKNLTTEPMFFPEDKGDKFYRQKNTFNFIINSNKEAIQLSADNKRRVVSLDINECYINNVSYFEKLVGQCYNKECGKCFYAFMRDSYDPKFKANVKPLTKSYAEGLQKRQPLHIKYLKEVIRKGTDLQLTCDGFYADYSSWCKENKRNPSDKLALGKSLEQIEGIKRVRKSSKGVRNYVYEINIQVMYDYFKTQDYINEYDNIIVEDGKVQTIKHKDTCDFIDDDDDPDDHKRSIADCEKIIKQQAEEIEKLKKLLEQHQLNKLSITQEIKKEVEQKAPVEPEEIESDSDDEEPPKVKQVPKIKPVKTKKISMRAAAVPVKEEKENKNITSTTVQASKIINPELKEKKTRKPRAKKETKETKETKKPTTIKAKTAKIGISF